MGKDNKKKSDFTSMGDLMEEQKKLKKKMGKIQIPCSHTNEKGKLKVDFLGDGGKVRCKRCGAEFNFNTINEGELDKAIKTVHNAINQIKALSDDPDREQNVIRSLGELDYNLKETGELYKKTTSQFGKNKKKDKQKNDSFGSYGMGSIDFIGGKKNNKKY